MQLNLRHFLQEQKAALTEGDPAQYANAKLRLPQAHTLAHGANVTVAVIDSGVDVKHPELANAIADSYDALGSKEGPHVHGTGIAGAIVSHARLMGSAPAARILAIRAFAAAPNGGESTSFVILKALDYAAAHGAQIVNMSFAGPNDALIERGISAAVAKGIVMVAAAGNAGAKSPALYPAANRNVIAVSATDAKDRLFAASNRGGHIAVSAPGVDIFLPAPDEKYQVTSGTSFSAAYISGLAALLLERNPALKPDEVRAILMKTARDLGAPGRDDLFGAGEADAYAAVSAVAPRARDARSHGFGQACCWRCSRPAGRSPDPRSESTPCRHGVRQVGRWRSRSARRALVFRPKSPAKNLKKSQVRLNVLRPSRDTISVGAVIPPHRGCIRRERPSTPSAPIWLDPSGCPPGRVFRFRGYFRPSA